MDDYQLNEAELVVVAVVDAEIVWYNMVFVPFTAVDNDGKSVTLLRECLKVNAPNRTFWLPESFMTTFYKQPTLVIPYQDAMKRMWSES
ncbi:FAR1 DNA binding domain, Zinc finger, SWIM-type, MULE transposase domain, FHY3/FAR1 family [Artemisia annua]|uniref:FAR1 DNA binding domain, Zinc finger, SWIM-type, MULE transposase domain, FHY3/FAR1 family n=1 Tax=Artemisia annua TaxID=35608 RepID=A0A2U1P465_ARTAN|nr:FAR1 DNA binding domain, Zinc finger, SWIM-type, MULE transposase domain, FHY3/FAR1 family [Artemisia annua]